MKNVERSDSGGRRNWPVTLAGCVGAAAGMALSWLVLSLAGLSGFWPGLIGTCIGVGVGVGVGQLAGSLVFRRPPR